MVNIHVDCLDRWRKSGESSPDQITGVSPRSLPRWAGVSPVSGVSPKLRQVRGSQSSLELQVRRLPIATDQSTLQQSTASCNRPKIPPKFTRAHTHARAHADAHIRTHTLTGARTHARAGIDTTRRASAERDGSGIAGCGHPPTSAPRLTGLIPAHICAGTDRARRDEMLAQSAGKWSGPESPGNRNSRSHCDSVSNVGRTSSRRRDDGQDVADGTRPTGTQDQPGMGAQ
jgi:hypothetical protein